MTKRIAIIPGDGIGLDVTTEATKVLKTLSESRGLPLELVQFDWECLRLILRPAQKFKAIRLFYSTFFSNGFILILFFYKSFRNGNYSFCDIFNDIWPPS